ncbi:hypothetical protein T265_14295, partial [Opisthorchis viverrini]
MTRIPIGWVRWPKWLELKCTDRKVRDLGNLEVSYPSCFLRVAWKLGIGRVLQLNEFSSKYFVFLRICLKIGVIHVGSKNETACWLFNVNRLTLHRLPGSTNLTDFDANSIFMQQTINHDNFPECYMAFVAQLGPFLSHAVSKESKGSHNAIVRLESLGEGSAGWVRLRHEAAWWSTFSCLETSQTRDSTGFQ